MTTPILRICRRLAARLALAVSLTAFVFPAVALAQSETIEYYGLDALGSVRAIFDQQGNLIDRMDYGPFGENLRAAIKFPTDQFAQLAKDAESGQDYAQARNYSAGTARFNRIDPVYSTLFNPQKWNRYAYAANSPLVNIDPSGFNECPTDPEFGEIGSCTEVTAADPFWKTVLNWFLNRTGGGGSPSSGPTADTGGGFTPDQVMRGASTFLDVYLDVSGATAFNQCATGENASACPGAILAVLPLGKAPSAAKLVAKIPATRILYRTVSAAELASIQKLARYAVGGVSAEGKYFYPTLDQARALARAGYGEYGPQTLTSVTVPDAMLQQATHLNVLGEGAVVFFPESTLPQLGSPTVWTFWPWR